MSTTPVRIDPSTVVRFDQPTPEEQQAQKLQQSVAFGSQQNPDEYAKLLELQKKTGVAPQVAQGNEADVRHAADVNSLDYPALAVSHPRTTVWASNPDNAAVAGVDEIHRLTGMESRAASIGAMPSFGQRLQTNYDKGSLFSLPGVRSVSALYRTIADTFAVRDIPVNFGGRTMGDVTDSAEWLAGNVNAPTDRPLAQINDKFGVVSAAHYFTDNRPKIAPQGTLTGAIWTAVAGITNAEANKIAGLSTIKNLAILSNSGDLSPTAKAVMDTYFTADMLRGLAEVPQRVWNAPNWQEKITAGVEGIIDAVFAKQVAGGIGGGHTAFHDDMAHLITSAEESKLRQRSPDKFLEAQQHIWDGQESLRIPVEQFETYFQSKQIDPAQAAQQLGVKNYAEAKVSGGDLEVGKADYFGKLDPEHQKGLLGDVVNPSDGLTFNQRQEGEQELQRFVAEGGMEKVLADAQKVDAETQASPEYQDIKSQLRQQYEAAGETPEIADNYATLQANVYSNWAREAGMKPAELMALHAPKMKVGEAPAASLMQDAGIVPVRFAAGKKLTPEQRAEVIRSMVDVYKAKNAPIEEKGQDQRSGDVIQGYKYSPELFEKSDITGKMVRRYVTLPDGRKAHPSELFPELTDKAIEKELAIERQRQKEYDAQEKLREHRIVTEDANATESIRGRANYEYSKTGRSIEGSYFATDEAGRMVRVDGKDPQDVARWENKGFKQSSPAVSLKQGERGWFRVLPDGSFEIGKTKIGDLSTFVHEPAHSYLFLMSELSKREGASDNLKGDYQKILDYLGAKEGEALTTDQHEKWARANEQYLREGKAPSEGLKGVFQRFAVWLTTIYKRASDLGVELSDDIRGVFDRMYAAEDGVNRAAKDTGPALLFSNPDEAGITAEQAKNYANAKNIEIEQAKSELLGKLNEAAVRERSDAWKEEEKNVREAVATEIDARPEYQAIRALRDGKLPDGTELKLNREELVKQFGEERVKQLQDKHKGLYRKEGGVDADVAAEMLGFGSGDEMLKKLADTPRRAEAIDTATRAYMTAKHGDIRYDGTLDDQARIALENDTKSARLHKELKDTQKQLAEAKSEGEGKKQAARSIEVAPIKAYREAARQMIEGKALVDIQPQRYLDASRVYSREAFDAMRKGDAEEAAQAKHKELMNHFLFREAAKAKELGTKWEAYGKKMATAQQLGNLGRAGQPFLDQIRSFLDRYSFRKESNASIRERQETLAQFLTRMKEDENYEIPLDPMLLDESRQRNYREVPFSELRSVIDAMKAIEKAARRVNTAAAEGKRVALDTAAAQLESKLFESLGEPEVRNSSDRARSWLEKFKDYVPDISVIMPEFIFERWDGLKKQGPWHDYLWDRYTDAVDHKNRLLEKIWPQLENSLSANIDRSRKYYIKSMDVTLTKDDILSIAHNAGNESNLDKQMRGGLQFGNDQSPRPMTAENLIEILSHLSAEEIDLVNSNWKAVSSLKPDAAELARKRSGIEPPWIEPKPLQVKNGTLEGGYWPIHYDPRFSAAGEKQVDTTLSVDKTFAQYSSASTNQGYLVGRTGFVAPLSLDWQGTMSRHLNDVVTDISHWEFASDAQRLLKHPQTKSAIISRMGELYYKNLLSWVKYTVKQGMLGPEPSDTLEGFRRNMRSKVSTAVLGFRVANAAVETGITPILALQHVSIGSSLHGVTTFLNSPIQSMKFAAEASDYIRHIDTGIDRNVSEAMTQLRGDHSLLGDIRRWSIQARVQIWKIGAVMAWHAGYHDAMSRGLEGKAAVREADSIYRMTQEAGRPGDLSSVQRNSNVMNELTMFIGPSLIQYNNLRRSAMAFKDQGLTPRTAGLGVTTLLAGLAANTVLFDALRGKSPDDPKKIPAWILARLTFGAFDGLPIINQFSTYAERKVLGEPGGDMKLIPVLQVGKDTVDAALKTNKAAHGQATWPAAVKQDAKAIGSLTGFPALQTTITGQYIYDVLSGQYKPAHPWSPVTDAFYARPPKK